MASSPPTGEAPPSAHPRQIDARVHSRAARAPDVSSHRVPWLDACDPTGAAQRSVHPGHAASLGVSSRMLEGDRFVRIHPRVWRHRDHEMTADDDVRAAALALPAHAHTTGITRIQQLGLDFGPRRPLRFVVQGDLHLALDGIFLHRTRALPPTDGVGVAPAARLRGLLRARSRHRCDQGGRLAAAPRAHGSRRGPRPGARPAVAGRRARGGVGPRPPRRAIALADGVRDPCAPGLLRAPPSARSTSTWVSVGSVRRSATWCPDAWGVVVEYEGSSTRRTATSTSSTSAGTPRCAGAARLCAGDP